MSNQVSWRDYQGADGFGASTQKEVDELNKALTAGQEINAPGTFTSGDGFALRVESLEKTMKVVQYRMEHLRLFKALPKLAAFNTIEEHNVLRQYGSNNDNGFISEGDLPEEDDSLYERQYAVVRFIGVTRRVTHVMSLVRPAHGNVIALETVNGTMHLLKLIEKALFTADNDLSSLQFDGFEKLITQKSPASNIIDLRGKPLSEDNLTDACLTVMDSPNFGLPTHLFLNPKTKADLVKTFFPKERHDTFSKQGQFVGLDVKGFTSPAGDVTFEPSVFIDDGGAPTDTAIGPSAHIPGTPTLSTPAGATGDPLSKFELEDKGDYFYKVQAVNRYGRSAPLAIGAGAITVDAGDKVTFGVTPSGANAVEYYQVYRTKVNGAATTCRSILRVKNAGGVGEQLITDYNNNLPGCTNGYLFQMNLESVSIKQLAPMVKIPLATIDSSIRWMQLCYLVPVLYAPGKNLLIKNIGRSAGYVGGA